MTFVGDKALPLAMTGSLLDTCVLVWVTTDLGYVNDWSCMVSGQSVVHTVSFTGGMYVRSKKTAHVQVKFQCPLKTTL